MEQTWQEKGIARHRTGILLHYASQSSVSWLVMPKRKNMPYKNVEDGLYVIKQQAEKNGILIDHYGLVDVGNLLEHENIDGSHPVVIHQTPPSIRLDWLKDTGKWKIVGKVTDLVGAKERLKEAIKTPGYDLFGNNCEHFAKFVAFNQKHSSQLFWGVVSVSAVGVLAFHLLKRLR